MNMYLNPKKSKFKEILTSKIYVDKTELLAYTNSVLCTSQKYICVSCPDGFGKSITAGMLTSYYGKGENSDYLFNDLKISRNPLYKQYLNYYNVITLNIRDFLGESSIKALMKSPRPCGAVAPMDVVSKCKDKSPDLSSSVGCTTVNEVFVAVPFTSFEHKTNEPRADRTNRGAVHKALYPSANETFGILGSGSFQPYKKGVSG